MAPIRITFNGPGPSVFLGGVYLRDACPNGVWPPAFPCAPAGAPESKPLCCAQPFLLPIQSLMQTSLQRSCPGTKKMMPVGHHPVCFRAENGIRTRGPQLGKLMLYQLSYFRNGVCKCKNFLEGFKGESHLFNTHCGGRVYFSYENCREEHDEHYCCECNQVHREYCAPFKVDGYV